MDEMAKYIFGALQKNEYALRQVLKELNKQSRLTNRLVLFSALGTAYIYVSERRRKQLEKNVKQLREELEALKMQNVEEETKVDE